MAKHFGGGFGGGMNMQALMQQARKMQEQMAKAQAELDEAEIEGSAGGGLVTVVVNGHGALTGITIKPEAVDPEDIEMLEDLIIAAYNEAASEAEDMKNEVMPAGANGMF
ncbi:MAG: YbaB/EbfC family nucleoid-associated protein [Clostridia bacterium]|nr:YbaB/EbfC family nucleoid-associated protein [Clostridia bacterium]